MLSRSCNYFTKEILEYVSFSVGGGGEREWREESEGREESPFFARFP